MAKNINFEDVKNFINPLFYVEIKKIVELYSISTKTSFDDEMKKLVMPKPTGVIQAAETFIRDSQKGNRNLESYIKGEDRLPCYGRRPSKIGAMDPEFATITTAIDNRSYSVLLMI